MYTIYLKDEDLLKAEHFPAIALINEAANLDIIEFAYDLAHGIGCGYDYSSCAFWDDLDEYDQTNVQKYDGIWVTNEAGESVIVPYNDFYYYLETLYSRLTIDNFKKLNELRALLNTFKMTFCKD